MLSELERDAFEAVRPLLSGMEHNLTMAAVVDGTCPGQVWVDDVTAPRVALLSTPEGHFLAGHAQDGEAVEALRESIENEVLPRGREQGWACFVLHYPAGWEAALGSVFADRLPLTDYQQYFVLRELKLDWRAGLPLDFDMRKVDRKLLSQTKLRNLPRIVNWGEDSFGSIPEFLRNGFGMCLVHADEIVSWCIADCVSGRRCEVGIHTDERYRGRGFATLTVAAAAEHCFSRGMTEVGWHCWSYNLPSGATARAVGFEKVLDHYAIKLWLNEYNAMLAHGNLCLMRKQYAEAAQWYQRAFARADAGDADAVRSWFLTERPERARLYYKAACAAALAGDPDAAALLLDRALEVGTDRWLGW